MLKRSKDRKVATSFTASGNVRIGNSFGLPAGSDFSCPGATSVCDGVCYAGKLERLRPAVSAVMLHNWELLRNASYGEMVELLREMVVEFRNECDKWGARKAFRIHWDGDFFSREYAQAWAHVISQFPDVQFWVYTRSFTPKLDVTDILAGIDNLTVYISVDKDNVRYAPAALKRDGILPATLTRTMSEGAPIQRELAGKVGARCPELVGSIPLNNACNSCNLCIVGKAPIRFASSTKAGDLV